MKKILIIVPDITKAGGTERVAVNLANMLSDTYNITILSFSNSNAVPFYEINSKVNIIYNLIGNIPLGILKKIKWFYLEQ